MGLRVFNDAMSILDADLGSILINLIDVDLLDPKAFRRKLIRESRKLGNWVWDTFNFEMDNVEKAIESDSQGRVILNPDSEDSIPVPGIGYTATDHNSTEVTWSVIVKDSNIDSTIASGIEQKFNVEPTNTFVSNNVYTWYYTIVIRR